jgi:FkbM family methyltransferase
MREGLHSAIWALRLLSRRNYPIELDFIKEILKPSEICFDVGAHSGIWAYPLSQLTSQVYAFEAFPYYSRVLSATMKLLRVQNVRVVNSAVADRDGTVNLVWQDGAGHKLTGMSHIEASEPGGVKVSISAMSLDSLASGKEFDDKRVAFIKCDVEGYECHVLAGAKRVIEKWRPAIFAEAKDEWFRRYGKSSRELIEMMQSHLYTGHVFRSDGTLQQITAETYSGKGDILFRPLR